MAAAPEGLARMTPLRPLLREIAVPAWDRLLWASGAVATLGIVITAWVPPASELAVLFSLALLANGPFSMFLPTAVEPMVMVYARLYSWTLVAGIATLSAVLAEYVDYRLYSGVLLSAPLERVRNTRVTRFVVWLFERSPFWAVVIGALTPLPFWLVRICAVLSRYPMRKFLAGTALGRFPRFLAYAALVSVLPVTTDQIAIVGVALTVVFAIAIWLRSRQAARPAPPVP